MSEYHENADMTPVTILRTDAIDAAGALIQLARTTRRTARSRQYQGSYWAGYRAGLRDAAEVYEAAARRVQIAADGAICKHCYRSHERVPEDLCGPARAEYDRASALGRELGLE